MLRIGVEKRTAAVSGWVLAAAMVVASCGGEAVDEVAGASGKGGARAVGAGAAGQPPGGEGGGRARPPASNGNDGGGGEHRVYCGGCSALAYVVQCARHVVTAMPARGEPDFGSFSDPERACAATRAEFSGSSGAGAGGANAGGADAGGANAGGAPDGGLIAPINDCKTTYVDPPATFFDDGGCIGKDDQDFAGTCLVEDECCVIVQLTSCGV